MSPIKIAVFCGGRGGETIIRELLRWSNIQLTLLINAYDDGLSTGLLRQFISGMLGPSDFRKNLSSLLNPFSEGQYALKQLLEFRFPMTTNTSDIQQVIHFLKNPKNNLLHEPLNHYFTQLDGDTFDHIKKHLLIFFNYLETQDQVFDFRDCSIGNLIFSGVYLEQNNNFNATTKIMCQLVNSRALLVNVSRDDNRILVGLKEDGTLLPDEAHIVSAQSPIPIKALFLMKKPISPTEWGTLENQSIEEKITWLTQQQGLLPGISPEAAETLAEADIIIYAPGTQHSSLFPSYQITQSALKKATAPLKILVMNLAADHDTQSLSADDIVDRALAYMGDPHNASHVISHVLWDTLMSRQTCCTHHPAIEWISGSFVHDYKPQVHNGRKVVACILSLWKKQIAPIPAALDIFVDIHKRSLSLDALIAEYLEMDREKYISTVSLTLNHDLPPSFNIQNMAIHTQHDTSCFPETAYFIHWLCHTNTQYLVLLTGDGEYRFRDIGMALHLLESSDFGAVFGSRNQSRRQMKRSLQSAYGERNILSFFSALGAFLVSAILTVRFGVIFSDPLTGFRVFKRDAIKHIPSQKIAALHTPIDLMKCLMHHHIEIAELPVYYRTFSGFSDPYWRLHRGFKNLIRVFL